MPDADVPSSVRASPLHDQAHPLEYQYAAFISYRHAAVDRKWAVWLHRALETYRVPRRLVQDAELAPRIGRVFRDEEELAASADLSESIDLALMPDPGRIRGSQRPAIPSCPQCEWHRSRPLRK